MRRTAGTLMLIAAVACSRGGYHDLTGWTIDIPKGWHVAQFDSTSGNASAKGAQISNVALPKPWVVPRFPMQTNGKVLPPAGVSVVISIDDDPGYRPGSTDPIATPPLSFDHFNSGSCLAETACMSTQWFTRDRTLFLVSVKIGPTATTADEQAMEQMVTTLRFE